MEYRQWSPSHRAFKTGFTLPILERDGPSGCPVPARLSRTRSKSTRSCSMNSVKSSWSSECCQEGGVCDVFPKKMRGADRSVELDCCGESGYRRRDKG